MALKIDLRVPGCAPATEVAAFIRECEDAGFDGVGILDSQLLERDVFVVMAMAAQATSRIRLASAVTNPVTRHVSVLASAAKSVGELAPGRVELWVGSGYSSVRTIGVAPAKVREMRQSVFDLKRIMAGEDVSYNGVNSRLQYGDAAAPPVYISATGPRTIKLAGEVADGAVLSLGIHPKAVSAARELLAEGAKRAGRSPDEVELVLCTTIIINEDLKEAREKARPICVNWMMEEYNARWLRAMGLDLKGVELPKELWDLYPDVIHAEDWEKAKKLCAFLPDDLLAQICDSIGFIGTPDHCAQRIREAEAAGLDHLYLRTSDTYKFAHHELAAFRDSIFPALAAAK